MSIAMIVAFTVAFVVVLALVVAMCEAGAKADRKRYELETLAAADENKALGAQDDLFIWAFLAGK